MRILLSTLTAAVAAIALLSGLALAHSGATGIVKQRMDVMSDVGEQMKTIAAIMKGEVAFDGQVVSSAAAKMATHAEMIPQLFPEGSIDGPSEALPAIWQDWEEFTQLGSSLKDKAGALASVAQTAKSPTDLTEALVAVGATCKGCHEKFRLAK